MKAIGADVVLINPQYAPKVIAQSEIQDMIGLILSAAAQEKVDVFHRFALMRYWHSTREIPFETFLSPDGVRNAGSVADQQAGFGPITAARCGGDRVARRQCGQLDTPTITSLARERTDALLIGADPFLQRLHLSPRRCWH